MTWTRIVLSLVCVIGLAVILTVAAGDGRQPSPQSLQGSRHRPKAERKLAAQKRQLSTPAEESGIAVLSSGDSYDDFPSIAQASDGTLFAAYAAYYDGHDQIRIHKRLPTGQWSTRSYVPLARPRADIWMPQLAVDARDRVWVIWSEQTGQAPGKTGNWDLYARPLIGERWGRLVRLTTDPKPDINPHVVTDHGGRLHVVWQAHPENNGDIMLCRLDEKWSKPIAVTSGAGSDWYPRVAVDSKGVAWIAFDSYRNGDYDVFLTSVRGDQVGELVPVATSKYYEANASVACTSDDRVWVAWEQGGYNWGKDRGYWLQIQNRNIGSTLGGARSVQVAAYHDGQLWAAPSLAETIAAAGASRRNVQAMAGLATDRDGRVWLRFRQLGVGGRRGRGPAYKFWTENVTYLTENGWADPQQLASSTGRISVFSRETTSSTGDLFVAYSSDQRNASGNAHQPIRDRVLIATVPKPDEPATTPELDAFESPKPPESSQEWDSIEEREQVRAIREYRTTIGGTVHRIVRGDLHRHSELSWDVGPSVDGSYLDFYRYMIDVASMDFGSLTDHQGGGHYAYWWWLTEKSADMYYLPPRFVPLYGYERSATYPYGHRNIFHGHRGVPVFPFQLKLDQTTDFPSIGTGNLLENDTELLYEYLHNSGGIAIPHTSGTKMGTDWRDNDPKVEPVVEIYQGARNSYEVLKGPRVHDPENPPTDPPGGFKSAGMVHNAYAKGYRLGTISSSDHGSTHISYALVYTPANDRAAILDSILRRHTYGSTDNIIVDFTANGRFMGDEFDTDEKPTLELRVLATGKVARVDLVRDNEYIYVEEPGTREVRIMYVDMNPKRGTNMYYFRIVQSNGEVAWASPVWVNYRP